MLGREEKRGEESEEKEEKETILMSTLCQKQGVLSPLGIVYLISYIKYKDTSTGAVLLGSHISIWQEAVQVSRSGPGRHWRLNYSATKWKIKQWHQLSCGLSRYITHHSFTSSKLPAIYYQFVLFQDHNKGCLKILYTLLNSNNHLSPSGDILQSSGLSRERTQKNHAWLLQSSSALKLLHPLSMSF